MKGKIFTVQEVDTITPFGEIRKQNLDKLERHYLKLLTGKKPMKLGQDRTALFEIINWQKTNEVGSR